MKYKNSKLFFRGDLLFDKISLFINGYDDDKWFEGHLWIVVRDSGDKISDFVINLIRQVSHSPSNPVIGYNMSLQVSYMKSHPFYAPQFSY